LNFAGVKAMNAGSLQTVRREPASGSFGTFEPRTAASYEIELAQIRKTESQLREALAHDALLLRGKDALIEQQELMGKESNHRFLNDLQMVMSLLSLQGRAATNTETAEQLAIAANRVGMIARVHQRLHCNDGVQAVGFKRYLEDLCRDFSAMYSAADATVQVTVRDGAEIDLSAATAIPLGFIVIELLTNAAKHGKGRIIVRLEADSRKGYALSVSNEGKSLPDGFDPAAAKGSGMRLIRSFVGRIGGELHFGPGDGNHGTCFTVLFS